ncbi:MAG: hypothetical protein Greene071421_349 [Parcubacteria group bacterium Greene0714_21]|nr:MAG: hypothetical protein Greene041639_2 [Parcubacteria group bacterium Greene0416_39]TSC98333.1 MAG: hypothetical protein Greene101447_76 [Parcubacteria group bacterium Greene1014_47]TSD03983.1 MAG: hypothetical protein Greene071421_349 [Parcubacteria group bacterium Greene0714_21]
MELIGKPQDIAIALGMEASDPKTRVFVVTVQNLAPLISRMSYEKSDKDIKLYFTLKSVSRNEGLELLQAERSPETLLLERVLAKTERSQDKKLYMSALTIQDFEQTGANSRMLPNAIQRIRALSEPGFSYGVTFEEAGAKKGLLWTQNPNLIEEYKQTHRGIQKGNWILWNV